MSAALDKATVKIGKKGADPIDRQGEGQDEAMPAPVADPKSEKKGIFGEKKKSVVGTGRPSAVAAQPKEEKKLQTLKTTKGQDSKPEAKAKESKAIDDGQDAPILGLDSNNN